MFDAALHSLPCRGNSVSVQRYSQGHSHMSLVQAKISYQREATAAYPEETGKLGQV